MKVFQQAYSLSEYLTSLAHLRCSDRRSVIKRSNNIIVSDNLTLPALLYEDSVSQRNFVSSV